jgi:hypothetical protein
MKHLPLIILLSLLSCKERKQDCQYVLPNGYSLQFNQQTGEYVVKTGFGIVPSEQREQDEKLDLIHWIKSLPKLASKDLYFGYGKEDDLYSRDKEYNIDFALENAIRFQDSCSAKWAIKEFYAEIEAKRVMDSAKTADKHRSDSIQHIKDSINNDFKPVTYPKKHIIFDSLLSDGIYAVHISDSEILKTYKQVKDQAENQFR